MTPVQIFKALQQQVGKRVKGPGYRVCISAVSLLHTSAYVNLYEINL